MKLILVPLSSTLKGIYPLPNGTKLGAHQLFGHPDLARAIEEMTADGLALIYSDIYRTPQASRDARRKKKGVQPAGYSPHNVGLAVDLDISALLKALGKTKKELDELLEKYGLYCHRRDHKRGSEDWHYNALGDGPAQWLKFAGAVTSGAVEAKMQHLYGAQMRMTQTEVLQALCSKKVGLWDPSSRRVIQEAEFKALVMKFQKAWDLDVDGIAGIKTQRTLAFVTAERQAA